MLNKFLIPAALVATVVIAGIFAFMPVEKASTVHGTLATSTGQTTTDTNVDAEADGQDRAITFYYNMSHLTPDASAANGLRANATIVLGQTDVTYTGYGTLTAIPNNSTSHSGSGTSPHKINCGFETTGQDGTRDRLAGNATAGLTNFTRFSSSLLTSGDGISVILANGTGANHGGVCAGTIVLTSWPS